MSRGEGMLSRRVACAETIATQLINEAPLLLGERARFSITVRIIAKADKLLKRHLPVRMISR